MKIKTKQEKSNSQFMKSFIHWSIDYFITVYDAIVYLKKVTSFKNTNQ